jgi:uncharacterized protein (TIRG00374 family)
MKKTDGKLRRFLKYVVLFTIIYGLLLTFTNLRHLKQLFIEMDFSFFYIAIICSLAVYGIEGIFLRTSLNLFNEKIPVLKAMKYSLIINSVGYFISFGGLTPFATQIHILDHENISLQKATASRVLQVIFFNMFFNFLLIGGFLSLISNNKEGDYNLTAIIFTVSFFFLLITTFYLSIFLDSFRDRAIKVFFIVINSITGVFSKTFKLNPKWAIQLLDEFQKAFKNTIKKPLIFITLFIITLFDWVFWLLIMYCSFLAINFNTNIGSLIIGFSIGHIVSIISMIPGGVGTMEGSMALVFTTLGIPLHSALGAILLYRVSFYIIPFFFCLPFYFSLKKKIEG